MSGATSSQARFEALGLTADEARAYISLLRRGRLGASDMATAARISRGRIYDVLKGLVSKGVVAEALTSPRTYHPHPPRTAIASLLERRRSQLEEAERLGESLVQSLSEPPSGASVPPDFIEVLRRPAAVQDLVEVLQNGASDEVLMFVRAPFFARSYAESDPEFRALARGVSLRCLYESTLLEDEGRVEAVREFIAAGGEARHTDSLPLKLAVFDREVTVLPMQEPLDPEDVRVLVIRHAGLSSLAVLGFESLWRQAVAFPTAVELTGRESG